MLAQIRKELQSVRSRDGAHASILSSRVRISRNLREPFVHRLHEDERLRLRDEIFAAVDACEGLAGARHFELEGLAPHERSFLAELIQVDGEAWSSPGQRGIVLAADPRQSILVGDEDHLRLFCLRRGFDLAGAYACADSLDAILEERLVYAFSEEFGYLGPSPWRAGTGLKASVLMLLPALTLSEELPRIFRALGALNFTVRGLRGSEAGSRDSWAIIANSRCLGEPEAVYLEQLGKIALKLDSFERRARERLLTEARSLLEDRVWSAYGQLRFGRLMAEDRARELLGMLHLGCLTELIQDVSIQEIQDIAFRVRDGQLQAQHPLDERERESLRAELLREWLAPKGGGKDKPQ